MALTVTDTLRIANIKESFSILDALKQVGVTTSDAQQVICPFHADSRPSARIYEDHLYCFTCQKGWDAIAVIRDVYGLTHGATLDWIESEFSLTNPLAVPVRAVKAVLRAQVPINLEPLFNHFEWVLLEARTWLTQKQFAQYTTAADVYRWQVAEKEVTAEACLPLLKALIQRLTPRLRT